MRFSARAALLALLIGVVPLGVASAGPVGAKLRLLSEGGANARAPGTALSPFGRSAGILERPVPVVVRFQRSPRAADIARLEALGLSFERGQSGMLLGRGRRAAAEMLPSRAQAVAGDPIIEHVELDGRPFFAPRPLDFTAGLVSGDAVRRTRDQEGAPIDGSGLVVCDIDSGIDVLHPMFFRADGGYLDWYDENQNGFLDVDIDSIDFGAGPQLIRRLNGVVYQYSDDAPLFGTESPALDLAYDYLYADANDDGRRNAGEDGGFTEETPTYGERLFVADDVDGSGAIEHGEKIVALGSSKIRAFRLGNEFYRRGQNLIEAPFERDMQHGNGAAGVMVGGQPGLRRLVGIAPEADLIMATDRTGGREFAMTSFCIDEGARVVLHEYAPWVSYHLDGSSDLEQLIDESGADGVAHFNPAGNLSGSQKLFKRSIPPNATTQIPIEVPAISSSYMVTTLLWRDTARDLHFTLSGPSGSPIALPLTDGVFEGQLDGLAVYASREDSDRGTAKIDLYVYPAEFTVPIGPGTWSLAVTDPSPATAPPVELIATVFDEVSGWSKGIHFPENSSEDHLIGWPGTADHGLAVAAFTGHDFGGDTTGARASYSGRGHRIDGLSLLAIAAPDNPIVPARFEGRELSFMVYGGTSGASPHVAGAAALLIAADPWLDGAGVRSALTTGAVEDSFTGPVPNDDFGHGKLDVYRAVYGVAAPGGSAPVVEPAEIEMPIGMLDFAIDASDADEPTSDLLIEVDRDYDGVYEDVLRTPTVRFDYGAPAEHFVKVRVTDSTGRYGQALVRVTVVEAPIDPAPADGSREASIYPAGGGCAASGWQIGATGRAAGWLGLGAMVAACALRRRRRAAA